MRGDDLIEQIATSDGEDERHALTDELRGEFERGFPIERLRPMLRHPDRRVVESAAYVAQALAPVTAALMDDVAGLLEHESPAVRGDVLCAVLYNVRRDGDVLARALRMVRDGDASVNWLAMRFATQADRDQLEAAAAAMSDDDRAALMRSGLLDRGFVADREKVARALDDDDPLVRRWAAATAARWDDEALLAQAANSDEYDIASFADIAHAVFDEQQ